MLTYSAVDLLKRRSAQRKGRHESVIDLRFVYLWRQMMVIFYCHDNFFAIVNGGLHFCDTSILLRPSSYQVRYGQISHWRRPQLKSSSQVCFSYRRKFQEVLVLISPVCTNICLLTQYDIPFFIVVFCGTHSLPLNNPECEESSRLFNGILFVPHNTILDLNNVVVCQRCDLQLTSQSAGLSRLL